MSWSISSIIALIFILGFCAGNIFQIWVRPKEDFNKSEQDDYT